MQKRRVRNSKINFIFALCMKSKLILWKQPVVGKEWEHIEFWFSSMLFFFFKWKTERKVRICKTQFQLTTSTTLVSLPYRSTICFCSAYFSSKSFSKAVSILEINYAVSSFSVFKISLMAIPSSLLWENVVLIIIIF
jgi:hypothetical protein